MEGLVMPALGELDQAVVYRWQDVWKNTPFQTIKYFARLHGTAEQAALYQNLPGGNCFDFARAFIQGNTTISHPRIVSYEITAPKFMSHGLCSFVNKEHPDRAYNCDSGFFKLIRMPPRTETLHYVKGDDQGPARKESAPPVEGKNHVNKYAQYRCEYAHGQWKTEFYPMKMHGLVAMGAIQAEVAEAMAYDNARRQSATLYLPRMMSAEGNPSWGDYITLYFADSSKERPRGTVVFSWANASHTEDQQTTLRLQIDAEYAKLYETLERLFGKYAEARLLDTAQWSQAMQDCLQMLLNMLIALVRT